MEDDGIKWEVRELGKMDELYERACQKLESEADKHAALGEIAAHVKAKIRGDIDACSAVLSDDKTVSGAYDAIKAEARKRWDKDRKQEGVCITKQEAEPIINAYYGISDQPRREPTEEKPKSNVVSLFDMW